MESISLDLEVPKKEIIRGESIRFVLTLTNTGDVPVTTLGANVTNQAFWIRVKGGWGFDAWGNQMSIQEREGEHIDAPREMPEVTLAPGEKLVVRGDVMAWIGELEPAEYSILGQYRDVSGYRTDSPAVEVKVTEASPMYARSAVQNSFLSHSPRSTAWLHGGAAGAEIFFLQSSPTNPVVTYANVPMAKIEPAVSVFPTSCNISAPRVQHLVWASADGNLQVVRFRSDLPPEAPLTIPLPDEDLEPFATPYSDERGNLHAVLATPDGSSACLFQLIGKGTPAFHAIKASPPLEGPRCALWYQDEVLALAWTEPEGQDVFAATVPLDAPPRPIVGKKVFTAEQPVIDLLLAQRFNPERDAYDRLLLVLSQDMVNDILIRWRLNIADQQAVEDGRFVADGVGNLKVSASVMTEDLQPLYLFAGPDGAVVFADSAFSSFTPILNSMRQPVRTSAFPDIVVPSKFSKIPARYVRYIEQGKRLAYMKLS